MYVYSMYNSVSMQHQYIAVATYSVYVHTVLGKHALNLHSACMYIPQHVPPCPNIATTTADHTAHILLLTLLRHVELIGGGQHGEE